MKKQIISYIILLCFCLPSSATLQQKAVLMKKQDDKRYRLARQFEAAGRFKEALQIYQGLWNNNPQNLTYYRGVKNNLNNLKRYSEAVQTIEKMFKIKRSYYIEADLGEVYYKLGNADKAYKIWDQIIERNRTQSGAYQAVANSMISNRLFDKAIEIYKIGRKNNNNNSLFLVELANLYNSQLDYKNTTLMYLEYLKYMPRQFSFVEGRLAKLAKDIEEIEPIIEIITKEIEHHKEKILLRKLLAGLYMQTSNYRQALEAYQFIDKDIVYNSSNKKDNWGRELFNFAQNALNDGAYEYSEQAFSIMISRYPNSPIVPRAHLGLAEAAYRRGDYNKAIEAYKRIIESYPRHNEALKSYLKVGEIKLIHFLEPDSSREAFKAILNKFPFSNSHFEAMFKLAECEIYLGNTDLAKIWYQKAIASKRATDEIKERANFQLALIDFWQGNFDSASERLEQITQVRPIFKKKEKSGFYVNDALELSIFIAENRQEPEILKKYAECSLLINRRFFDESLIKLKTLVESNPQSQLAGDIWFKIAEVENELNQYQEAIAAFRTIIDNYPKSVNCDVAQKRIGEIYETDLGEIGLAMKEYELVLTNYPESLLLEEVRKKIRELEKTALE